MMTQEYKCIYIPGDLWGVKQHDWYTLGKGKTKSNKSKKKKHKKKNDKNIQKHKNRKLGLTEALHMQHCSLQGCKRSLPPA